MNRQERTEGQPENPVVKVKLGEPFAVSSHLDSIVRQMQSFEDEDKEGIFPVASVNLEIEDIGKGRVNFLKDFSIIEDPSAQPIRTPAGPVEVKYTYRIDNDSTKLVKDLPIGIAVEIDDLNKNQLDTVTCALNYDNEKFEGVSWHDDVELERDNQATLDTDLWIDPKTKEDCELLFPSSPEDLKQILGHVIFTITEKK